MIMSAFVYVLECTCVCNSPSPRHKTKVFVWACLAEWFNTPASADVLNLTDKRVDPGCWLRPGFKSPRGRLVESLFQDPIGNGCFTGATLCFLLGLRANELYPSLSSQSFCDSINDYLSLLGSLLGFVCLSCY